MNEQTKALFDTLLETAIAHIVQRVIQRITPEINVDIDAKVESIIDAKIEAAVSASLNVKTETVANTLLEDEAFKATLRRYTATFVEEKMDADSPDEAALKKQVQGFVQGFVQDYLDDNRTLSRMDESIDDLCTRLDDLETAVNDEGTGMSRKLRNEVEGIVQDKLDASDIITNDNLAGEVERILNNGSFSTSFSV